MSDHEVPNLDLSLFGVDPITEADADWFAGPDVAELVRSAPHRRRSFTSARTRREIVRDALDQITTRDEFDAEFVHFLCANDLRAQKLPRAEALAETTVERILLEFAADGSLTTRRGIKHIEKITRWGVEAKAFRIWFFRKIH